MKSQTNLLALLLAIATVGIATLPCAAATPSESMQEQNSGASGKVMNQDHQPVAGLGVLVKGTTQGTMTDENGNFSIANVRPGSTLLFSGIGYKDQEVTYNGQPMSVMVEESTELLEESVVTALGIKRERKALGYSVDDISASELMKNKTANPINSLSGKIAGVNVTQSSGAAGAGTQIILRGGTSASENRGSTSQCS